MPNPELLMKKVPLQRDLLRLFNGQSDQWQTIGTGLGVSHSDLMPLPGQALNNLGMIFDRWLKAYKNVTWKAICNLCEDWDQLGQSKAKVAKFLESDRAHEEYGTKPDFDG
uniref:Death domain-containing protein n=1 Tax=Amphimedon queenslandica TaxID=400682 RepID=A0A1X7V8D2_AMPQE